MADPIITTDNNNNNFDAYSIGSCFLGQPLFQITVGTIKTHMFFFVCQEHLVRSMRINIIVRSCNITSLNIYRQYL